MRYLELADFIDFAKIELVGNSSDDSTLERIKFVLSSAESILTKYIGKEYPVKNLLPQESSSIAGAKFLTKNFDFSVKYDFLSHYSNETGDTTIIESTTSSLQVDYFSTAKTPAFPSGYSVFTAQQIAITPANSYRLYAELNPLTSPFAGSQPSFLFNIEYFDIYYNHLIGEDSVFALEIAVPAPSDYFGSHLLVETVTAPVNAAFCSVRFGITDTATNTTDKVGGSIKVSFSDPSDQVPNLLLYAMYQFAEFIYYNNSSLEKEAVGASLHEYRNFEIPQFIKDQVFDYVVNKNNYGGLYKTEE